MQHKLLQEASGQRTFVVVLETGDKVVASLQKFAIELKRSETLDSAHEQFVTAKLSALAGLRPRLLSDLEKLPGARILDGRFMSGTSRKNPAGAVFLRDFVEEAKSSGLVARLIERYEVRGLSVAPLAA